MNFDVLFRIAEMFGLPFYFLEWPLILTNLIIPFVIFAYALECIMEKIRIFYNPKVNLAIAIAISFCMLPFIPMLSFVMAPSSIFVIGFLKIGGAKGFVLGMVLAALYWIFIPVLIIILSQF
ncbi:MAG: hypothetical protein QXX38_00635 [Candidatus Aenigmatarchaeota archaeon]